MLSGGAMASTTSIHFANYCDVYTFTDNAPFEAMQELSSSCTADIMGGFNVKVLSAKGKWAFVGGPRFGDGTDAWGILVQLPFKTGHEEGLYETTDGVNYDLIASTTYIVGAPAKSTKGQLPPMGKGKGKQLPNSSLPKTLKF